MDDFEIKKDNNINNNTKELSACEDVYMEIFTSAYISAKVNERVGNYFVNKINKRFKELNV